MAVKPKELVVTLQTTTQKELGETPVIAALRDEIKRLDLVPYAGQVSARLNKYREVLNELLIFEIQWLDPSIEAHAKVTKIEEV